MGSAKATVTLAKTNLFLSLAHEPHLQALSAQMQLIKLERTQTSSPRTSLPYGFIFPLDAFVALCGGVAEEGTATLIRFAGNQEFFRVDALASVRMSRVVRAGYAILIDRDVWMKFGAQFPPFLETMAEFVQGRNALSIVNATCHSQHRYSRRVARLLLEARAAFPENDESLPLTQHDIAELINTRRETIALELEELADAQIIETSRGKVRINNPQALRERSCGCIDRAHEIAEHQIELAKGLFKQISPNATPKNSVYPVPHGRAFR